MTAVAAELLDQVRTRLAEKGHEPTAARVADALRSDGRLVSDAFVLDAVDALRRETIGAGPLEPLLRMAGVTDVLVNGPGEVYLDRGQGLERTDVSFSSDDAVRRLAQRLAAAAGRRLDDASPYVDVRLRDGTRLHAVLAPLARPATCLSLRVPARRPLTLDDLVAAGATSQAGAGVLLDLVRSRTAFVVSGGTGTGKTTLLAALLSYVDHRERLVLVEDVNELRPRHPHVVALEARPPNAEGLGEVTVRALVRQAMRMRPDRLVVGEVRGAEIVDMLAAMNTGHEGGCGTVHANSARDVPARFEALGIAAGLPRPALHSQLASAVHAVIHLRRGWDGVRRVVEIAVVSRRDDGLVEALPALVFSADQSARMGPGAKDLDTLLSAAP